VARQEQGAEEDGGEGFRHGSGGAGGFGHAEAGFRSSRGPWVWRYSHGSGRWANAGEDVES
jgi:hypothetical protein